MAEPTETEPIVPAPLELEHVLIPSKPEAYVGRDRYIVTAVAVFNTIITAHVIKAVGGGPVGGPFDGIMLRLIDDDGTQYPVLSGGSGGSMNGQPWDASQMFTRPAGTSPKRLHLLAETRREGAGLHPLATVVVPE